MNYLNSVILCVLLIFCNPQVFSQKGPGGVSLEVAGPNSNCKMWLDASSIVAADGAALNIWNDESLSINTNTPTQTNALYQPTFRNDPAESVNGEPVVRFIPNNFLELLSSNDINTSGPYLGRTTFIAFRTGTDVTTRQMLWEQGGTVRGLNMYIFNGFLWFGGYDIAVDGDGAPSWGFVSTKIPVTANTVYVVTHVFDADNDGDLTTNDGSIYGYLNGELFSSIDAVNGVAASPVGSLSSHPNAPGLGAVNGDTYNELGAVGGSTGSQAFLGDMVEFIAYDDIVNDAERIIVENYLGSKYFANLSVNDYYDYQVNHGKEVIGIGRDIGLANLHNNSQGRNVFTIEANLANFDVDQEYFLIGNNNADIASWTVTDAPNLGIRTRRIAREWRADHSGDLGDITFTFDANDLPAGLAGYTKYCLVIDPSNGAVSNFNQASTQILEMTNTSGSEYVITTNIPTGSYITIAIVDPMVEFVNVSESGFELSGVGVNNFMTVNATLNYIPATAVNAGLNVTDNTATLGAAPVNDYNNVLPTPGSGALSFVAGNQFSSVNFDIMGDLNPEPTEDFNLIITATGITADLDIGTNSNLSYTIFDDDNVPKVAFALINSSVPESVGVTNIEVVRTGSTVNPASVDYRLRIPGGNGTATSGTDYTFITGTANFPALATSFLIPVTIIDDLFDEPNETIILELFNNVDADIEAAFQEHELTIIDNDSPPTVTFAIINSQGPETMGLPSISVILSSPSSQIVEVDYQNLLTGTATLGLDYTIATTGTIVFTPGDTLEFLPLIITNDALDESDETINFELIAGSEVNTTIGVQDQHEYTIKDYTSFEWLGAAGIGQRVDNIFWLKAGNQPELDGGLVATFNDFSPNMINVASTGGNRPTMDFSGPNSQKQLTFDGNDFFDVSDNASINTSTFFTQKSIWVTFTTGADVTSRQMIYEQGGSTRGISIYIDNSEIYYNVWSNANDNGAGSAWGTGSPTGSFEVVSSGSKIVTNSNYIAMFDYTIDAATGELKGYLNGELIGTSVLSTTSGVPPRLYSHGDNGSIGGVVGSTRYHDNTGAATFFTGSIQELIHFSDAPVNNARRIIIDNHLSSKYDIDLVANQFYSTTYATQYNNEVAGIGQFNNLESHSNSQGTSILRINNPSDLDVGDYLIWGHDSVKYTPPAAPVTWTTPPTINNALHRVWRVSELGGDIGAVDLRFDLSNWTVASPSDLYLMVDSDDGDFFNATLYPLTSFGSNIALFSNINLNNGQWFTIGSTSFTNLLPIELLNFDAKSNGNKVDLTWSTASELNNDYFIIERSTDMENWTDVATQTGAGNSSDVINYVDTDRKPLLGTSFYRLKQVDFDGNSSYSDIKSVIRKSGEEVSIYPNPMGQENGVINLVFDKYESEDLIIILYDASGRISFYEMIKAEDRQGVQPVHLGNLAKGLYNVQLVYGQHVIAKKIVVN